MDTHGSANALVRPIVMSAICIALIMVLEGNGNAQAPVPVDLGGVEEWDDVAQPEPVAEKGIKPVYKMGGIGGAILGGLQNAGDIFTNPFSQVDPAAIARRELEKARKSAMRNLRRLDPNETLSQIRASLNLLVRSDSQLFNGIDLGAGTVDLRGTAMGASIDKWLNWFAQGNRSNAQVRELMYNFKTHELVVSLYVRHCHSWGKAVNILGDVNLYEVRQTAEFRYEFNSSSGEIKLNLGGLAPNLTSKTFEKLADGEILAALESVSPEAIGNILGIQRSNKYKEKLYEYEERYGRHNVYFASYRFVTWASPANLRQYLVEGILTGGASLAFTLNKIKIESLKELGDLSGWLRSKWYLQIDPDVVAGKLLAGERMEWPFLKIEPVKVRYSARETNLGNAWRHEDHFAFAVILDDRSNTNQPGMDAPPMVTGRWVYVGGHFAYLGSGKWIEIRDNGPSSNFREIGRGGGYVHLYDFDRKLNVLLTTTAGLAASAGSSEWAKWSDGAFN